VHVTQRTSHSHNHKRCCSRCTAQGTLQDLRALLLLLLLLLLLWLVHTCQLYPCSQGMKLSSGFGGNLSMDQGLPLKMSGPATR
jgi:hypothetical protein